MRTEGPGEAGLEQGSCTAALKGLPEGSRTVPQGVLAGLLVIQLFVQPGYSPAEASGEPRGDAQGNAMPQAETTKPVSAGRPVDTNYVTWLFLRHWTSGTKTGGPGRRQRAARGSPCLPSGGFPGGRTQAQSGAERTRQQGQLVAGPQGGQSCRRGATVGGGCPGVCSRVQIRKAVSSLRRLGRHRGEPSRSPTRARSQSCRTRPACPGVCLHIARANVRHLKATESPKGPTGLYGWS